MKPDSSSLHKTIPLFKDLNASDNSNVCSSRRQKAQLHWLSRTCSSSHVHCRSTFSNILVFFRRPKTPASKTSWQRTHIFSSVESRLASIAYTRLPEATYQQHR